MVVHAQLVSSHARHLHSMLHFLLASSSFIIIKSPI
jgi:hypothetical protein